MTASEYDRQYRLIRSKITALVLDYAKRLLKRRGIHRDELDDYAILVFTEWLHRHDDSRDIPLPLELRYCVSRVVRDHHGEQVQFEETALSYEDAKG